MKNKFLKKIFVVFTLIMTFFQNILGVYAAGFIAKPLTVVYQYEYSSLGSTGSSIKVRKVKYTDASGATKYGFAYCLEGGAGTVSMNDRYTPDLNNSYASSSTGEILDDGIRYITTHGFWGNGNVSSGATTESENVEFAITQLAIWLYYYDVSRDETKYDMSVNSRRVSSLAKEVRANRYNTGNSTFVRIVNEANSLCEGAKKARLAQVACEKDSSKCNVEIAGSLNASVSGNALKLSADGKYLESDLITVSLTGVSSARVSVSDTKFTIVSENGSVVSSVKNGDKVKVRILKDNVTDSINVNVNFTSTSSERNSYQYYGGTYTYNGSTLAKQRLLFTAGYETTTLSKTLKFSYELVKKDVEFSKIDVSTGKELPGATLEVRDSNGNLVEKWVSTNQTHYIKLAPGKYTLKETIAPEGYELSTETIEFEVKEDGTTTKVVMENKPIKKDVYVEFSKIDVTTGKELPGATLEVRDSNGKLIEKWVSTNQTHYIKLAPGKYTLKETIAPEGYELSTKTITFEVKEDGTTTKVVMENKPSDVNVEFSKIDVSTGKELPGATLEVRDSNGKLIERWVSTNHTHYIKLAPGKYTLKETIAPEGYELSTETISFEVKVNGTTTKVVMRNKPIKDENIYVEFSKIDVTTGKELPGATLEVMDSNGKLIEKWVSTTSTHYIKLAPGKYTLTETIAPAGYELSTKTVEFEVKENGTTTKVVMENKPIVVDVEFSKIDVTTGKELPGATLEVRDSNGKLIELWVSTDKPHYISLAPGKYTLTEIVAPEGYDLSTKTVEFEVKVNGTTTKVVMENKPSDVNVEFSKIDVTTGKELPGATLEVRDSNGKLIESWVSTDKTHYIKLAPGKYTLTEIVAPEGYILSNETKEFEVKTDGSVTKVVMENKPSRVNVEFSKIDISTGKELPGAHLEIRDSEGNFVKSWISSDTPYYIELEAGKYTLTETLAPEGYELSTETIEFEVKLDGSVTKVVMENKPYIEVPITSLNASSTTMIIGSLLIGLGLVVVYSYVKKYEA